MEPIFYVVFGCESMAKRAPEAARIYAKLCKEKGYKIGTDVQIDTIGIRDKQKNPYLHPAKFFAYMFMEKPKQKILDRADLIFVMEPWMLNRVPRSKSYCLGVKDGSFLELCWPFDKKINGKIEKTLRNLPDKFYPANPSLSSPKFSRASSSKTLSYSQSSLNQDALV